MGLFLVADYTSLGDRRQLVCRESGRRGVAQLAESPSPIRVVAGSSPAAPEIDKHLFEQMGVCCLWPSERWDHNPLGRSPVRLRGAANGTTLARTIPRLTG